MYQELVQALGILLKTNKNIRPEKTRTVPDFDPSLPVMKPLAASSPTARRAAGQGHKDRCAEKRGLGQKWGEAQGKRHHPPAPRFASAFLHQEITGMPFDPAQDEGAEEPLGTAGTSVSHLLPQRGPGQGSSGQGRSEEDKEIQGEASGVWAALPLSSCSTRPCSSSPAAGLSGRPLSTPSVGSLRGIELSPRNPGEGRGGVGSRKENVLGRAGGFLQEGQGWQELRPLEGEQAVATIPHSEMTPAPATVVAS